MFIVEYTNINLEREPSDVRMAFGRLVDAIGAVERLPYRLRPQTIKNENGVVYAVLDRDTYKYESCVVPIGG